MLKGDWNAVYISFIFLLSGHGGVGLKKKKTGKPP